MIYLLSRVIASLSIEVIESEFDEYESAGIGVAVFFYGPKCPNCNTFLQNYDDSSYFFRKTPFLIVNCHENKRLCQRMSITLIPTLKYISYSPENHTNYNDSFVTENIVSFIERMTSEMPFYRKKQPIIINTNNFEYYSSDACLITAFYTPYSIKGTSFFPVIRNISRIYEIDNISLGIINCNDFKELCINVSIASLPSFGLYKNGDYNDVNGSSLIATVDDINKMCNTSRQLTGFPIHKSCTSIFERFLENEKKLHLYKECILPFDTLSSPPTMLKYIELLNKVLKKREASQSILDNLYHHFMATHEYIKVYNNLFHTDEI